MVRAWAGPGQAWKSLMYPWNWTLMWTSAAWVWSIRVQEVLGMLCKGPEMFKCMRCHLLEMV